MTEAQREIINLLGDIKASQGGGAVGVTSVTGTAPIASSGGATPAISIDPATPSDPGSMSAADKTKLDTLSAHSGGVIGTARFIPANLPAVEYVTGVIASVALTSTGLYEVTFGSAQPDANYNVIPVASDIGLGMVAQYEAKGTPAFSVRVRRISDGSDYDAGVVEVTVTRLSQ